MEHDASDLITVPAAALKASVARNTMLLAAKNGTIKAIRIGRNWLIYASDIERWKTENYRPQMAARYPKQDKEGDTP
ncbi:MAG: helix-turn-helix domain-containing protein [Anaerolineae bacterium]|nr:helix-turn-helix domain-containing protein [Anaerolineae bacterium]